MNAVKVVPNGFGGLRADGSASDEAQPRAGEAKRRPVPTTYKRSRIVALAMPPPSHMVCRP